MDKQTLSNYGWIVICTLVLATMIAFATPFSEFIKASVLSTQKGLEDTSNGALGVALEDMGIAPSVDELQRKYEFIYYDSINTAINNVNNGTIGTDAIVDKTQAECGIYINDNIPNIVLLKNITLSTALEAEADLNIYLGGFKLTRDNRIFDNKGGNVTIDGRYKGSEICNKNANTIQNRSGTLTIIGGTYRNLGADTTKNNIVIKSVADTNVYDAKLIISNDNGTGTGIQIKGATLDLKNSYVEVNSKYNNMSTGIYAYSNSVVNIEKSTIITNTNYIFEGGQYKADGIAIYSRDTELNVLNCNVKGMHSGIQQYYGTLYINGGTYEGFGHGGLYLNGNNSNYFIENATLKQCDMIEGYTENAGTNEAGAYIGGAGSGNSNIYFNNCKFYGKSYPFVIKGSDNETGNNVYVSNSVINKDCEKGIRMDNTKNKLYIGTGNNFGSSDTYSSTLSAEQRNTITFITNEIYKK